MITLPRANGPYLFNARPPPPTGGQLLSTLEARLFNALGSVTNDEGFVLADSGLNCLKELVTNPPIPSNINDMLTLFPALE